MKIADKTVTVPLRGAGDVLAAITKEAFYRTFSGAGELFFCRYYLSEEERREYVHEEWNTFSRHYKDVSRELVKAARERQAGE